MDSLSRQNTELNPLVDLPAYKDTNGSDLIGDFSLKMKRIDFECKNLASKLEHR
jgi:hypothetical protein